VISGRIGRASCGHGWQLDDGIIAQGSDGFQAHVSASLHGPFIVLFEQNGADQSGDRVFVGEDTHDIGAPLDLTVEPLDGIGNRYESRGACASG
jgi:hypothetical protein